ncbi:hypothetical protein JVV96_21875, partial [Vibrio cholerae O1]|nr:hypothetical protein [Vibrio cholerae O1]
GGDENKALHFLALGGDAGMLVLMEDHLLLVMLVLMEDHLLLVMLVLMEDHLLLGMLGCWY